MIGGHPPHSCTGPALLARSLLWKSPVPPQEAVGDLAGGKDTAATDADSPNGDASVVVITKTVHVTVHATAASSTAAQPATTTKASEDIVAVGLEVDSSGHTSTLDVAPTVSKTSSSAQSTATMADSSDGTNPQDWVDLHNAARAKYGAEPVVWDEELAQVAKEHAEACNAAHTKAAENLQWGGGFGTPKGAVDAWMSEDTLYNWANPVYSDATGHFTQIVWKDTKKIGCYIAKCPVNTVQPASIAESFQTACEYDPAGNFVNEGAFAANVGVAVS
ncbi:hypothetical protein IAT38_003666 [Cryptococcus sp. DSM 104549]